MGRAEEPMGKTLFAADASKAYFERVSLTWAPLSLVTLLGGVLGTGLHEHCDRWTYLYISILLCVPGFVVPLCFPGAADRGRPLWQRFWVKAAVWIGIYSFYGNYFWTHYFYQLLGARYLFDAHRFNDVPLVCYLCTYFYFTAYFALVNVVLRGVNRACQRRLPRAMCSAVWWTTIAGLAYGTAVFEAVSIQHFPLYTYTDKARFVSIGSVVYALYFVVGFPMFFKLDEEEEDSDSPNKKATLYDVAVNALAATAVVTLLLDLWRLYLGNIYALGSKPPPVPFIYQRKAGFSERMRNRMSDAATLLTYNGRRAAHRWRSNLGRVLRRADSRLPQRLNFLRGLWSWRAPQNAVVVVGQGQRQVISNGAQVQVHW